MGFFSSLLDLFFNSPERVGEKGENLTASKLEWINLWGYKGMLLQNVYIPKSNGETTEIDLLYITEKGIFVIESKNYSGYIFGNEQYKSWTASLYGGKTWYGAKTSHKYKFYNPVWQNRTHIKYLRKYLEAWDIPMYSLIVFSDRCELKAITIVSDNVFVCKRYNMNEYIKSVWENSETCIKEETIVDIYNKLKLLTVENAALKEKHVQTINEKLLNPVKCPCCGGNLVLRTARQGSHAGEQFYGCSNYPKCRYIKNM